MKGKTLLKNNNKDDINIMLLDDNIEYSDKEIDIILNFIKKHKPLDSIYCVEFGCGTDSKILYKD